MTTTKTASARPQISRIPEISEGCILYDGRCPLCRGGARRLGRIAMRRGFRLVPLQRRWVRDEIARRADPVADEMLLLLPDGRLLGGVDAYIYLSWRVWWAMPLAVLASLPGLYYLTRKLYAWIAANRFRICGEEGCRVGS